MLARWGTVAAYAAVAAANQLLWLTRADHGGRPARQPARDPRADRPPLGHRRRDGAIWLAGNAGGIVVAVLVQAVQDRPEAAFSLLAAAAALVLALPEGSGRRVANSDRMSETENRTEPHVSTEELRAALTPRGETRRNPVLVSERDEGELKQLRAVLETADSLRTELDASRRLIDSARADAIELRAALDAARGDAHELRLELMRARAEAAERRDALSKLANAGFFRRRKVMAELKERNAF